MAGSFILNPSQIKDGNVNNLNNLFDDNGEQRRQRTGKELWAIARKLTYEKLKQQNFKYMMMEYVKAEKLRKQLEQKEKKEAI